MSEITISVASDYSRYPAGRYIADGPFNGERFRKKYLIPNLGKYDIVTVNLDGVRGVGSSFLEEAFGGLVRNGVSIETLNAKLRLLCADRSIIEEVHGYMTDAAQAKVG